MIDLHKVYEENKRLDLVFIEKYNHEDFVKKNKLELLVEIGELANETRCFKYWSNKEVNNDLVKEDYADCIIMSLCFFNYLNISLDEINYINDDKEIIDLFFDIYLLASNFSVNENTEIIKEILIKLINLGYKLGFTDEEIISSCLNKIKIDRERLK